MPHTLPSWTMDQPVPFPRDIPQHYPWRRDPRGQGRARRRDRNGIDPDAAVAELFTARSDRLPPYGLTATGYP
jgi:hypothetical protein